MTITSLFKERFKQWGLRGDPFLWDELESYFSGFPTPESESEFAALLEMSFEKLVGCPITGKEDVHVERYAHGGMSSGMVCLEFWRTKGFPELLRRYAQMFPPRQVSYDFLKLEDIQHDIHVFGIEPRELVRIISARFMGNDAIAVTYRTVEGSETERLLYRTEETNLLPAVPLEFNPIYNYSVTLPGILVSAVPQVSRPVNISSEEWTWRVAASAALTCPTELLSGSATDICNVIPTSICDRRRFAEFLRSGQQLNGGISEKSIFHLIDAPVEDLADYPFESPLENILAIAKALQQGKTLMVLSSKNAAVFLEAALKRLEYPGDVLAKAVWGMDLSTFQLGCLYGIGSDAYGKLQQLKRMFDWDSKHGRHNYEV